MRPIYIMSHSTCYQYDTLSYTHGWLDKSVDATYVIHLQGNGRLERVLGQLQAMPPTSTVYILNNRGYKTCDKGPDVHDTLSDIIDAYLHVFRHAQDHGYGHVLILEDDFIFREGADAPEHASRIAAFLNGRRDTSLLYFLGCVPFVQWPLPYHVYHRRVLLCAGAHACIYSRPFRDHMLREDRSKMIDWDRYHNTYARWQKYMYHIPLCYQLFPRTENSLNWQRGVTSSEAFNDFIAELCIRFFQGVGLDQHAEPGYTAFYWFSWLLPLFLVVLVAYGSWIMAMATTGSSVKKTRSLRK